MKANKKQLLLQKTQQNEFQGEHSMHDIEQLIADELMNWLNSTIDNPGHENFTHHVSLDKNMVEVFFDYGLGNSNPSSALTLGVVHSWNEIHISQVWLQPEVRKFGIMQAMINIVFHVGQAYGYSSYFTNITGGYVEKLFNKGKVQYRSSTQNNAKIISAI